jgi:hypothetical protein
MSYQDSKNCSMAYNIKGHALKSSNISSFSKIIILYSFLNTTLQSILKSIVSLHTLLFPSQICINSTDNNCNIYLIPLSHCTCLRDRAIFAANSCSHPYSLITFTPLTISFTCRILMSVFLAMSSLSRDNHILTQAIFRRVQ